MAVHFSRTTRWLSADNSRVSALGLFTALALIAAWIGWFLFGCIPLYEVSDSVRLQDDTSGIAGPDHPLIAVAEFSATSLGRIRLGQNALLRFEAYQQPQCETILASVVSIHSGSPDPIGYVELAAYPDDACHTSLENHRVATAEVEVDRVSPAELVLRALGGGTSEAAAGRE